MCDWYTELAMIGNALNWYCEYSLERGYVDGERGEVLAYGRDKEREAQLWCLRYSERGWGLGEFDEKCLGVKGPGGKENEIGMGATRKDEEL